MMLQVPIAIRIGTIELLVFEVIEVTSPFMEKDNEARMQSRVGSTCCPGHHREHLRYQELSALQHMLYTRTTTPSRVATTAAASRKQC
jgi:hypothetical protein